MNEKRPKKGLSMELSFCTTVLTNSKEININQLMKGARKEATRKINLKVNSNSVEILAHYVKGRSKFKICSLIGPILGCSAI